MHVLITQHVFLLWEQLLRDSVHLILIVILQFTKANVFHRSFINVIVKLHPSSVTELSPA